ncbi:MAG TPA: Rne/Rng family ribonuclease, partial [Acetobacteraceae bacterium]|nr:Rne/Rng family ribonuclease [Acetobacteraceae bacterium]
MTKRMLIDASHPEETRVVVLDGNRIEEFDIESANRKPLKGNIYLAKVVRVEPSLQAAFVEFGGNRHGFLAFGEIHPDYYQIPVADRQRLLAMQAEEAREEEEREEAEEAARENDRGLNEALRAAAPEADAPQAEAPDAPPAAPTDAAPTDAAPTAQDPSAGDDARGQDAAGSPAEDTPRGSTAMPMTIPVERRTGDAEELEAEAAEATVPHEGMPVAEHAPLSDMREPREEDEEAGPVEDAPPPETVGGDREEEGRERRIPPKFLRHYKIQEVIKRRQIMLVQVVKEERGTKGAALTTYISLAGRFSVLMPNSPRGGGVSRKITSAADRKRLREIIDEAGLPQGMSLIVRTAGAARPKPEIKRDCEYLLRLWDNIRERTFASTAPALIYEEADLIKRSVRDVYNSTIDEVAVEGEEAYQQAREFMRMLMPQHVNRVKPWRDGGMPLFARHGVDQHLDAMHSPVVQLKSGGYIVINQTEALVAIDVNSGRATRDRHIEDTALRTNLEAAEEVARQLRLRDLAGLIVIDFIDMESSKHDGMVERRLKEALKQDRARIQVGRISHFGLLEMSRQRLRPSMVEHAFIACPHCAGRGIVRSTESSALQVLRAIEEEASRRRAGEIVVACAEPVALWLLNRKRERLAQLEARNAMAILLQPEEALTAAAFRIERTRPPVATALPDGERPAALRMDYAPEPEEPEAEEPVEAEAEAPREARPPRAEGDAEGEAGRRRRRRRRRGRREGGEAAAGTEDTGADDAGLEDEEDATEGEEPAAAAPADTAAEAEPEAASATEAEGESEDGARRRRRGRRGGRRRREDGAEGAAEGEEPDGAPVATPPARRAGPTPADPFAGHMDDIYSAMEAAEAAAEAAAAARRAAQAEPGSPARAPAGPKTAAPVAETPVVEAPADPVPDTVPPVTDTAPIDEAQPVAAPVPEVP